MSKIEMVHELLKENALTTKQISKELILLEDSDKNLQMIRDYVNRLKNKEKIQVIDNKGRESVYKAVENKKELLPMLKGLYEIMTKKMTPKETLDPDQKKLIIKIKQVI